MLRRFCLMGLCAALALTLAIRPCAAESASAIYRGRNGAVINLDTVSLEAHLGIKKGQLDGVTVAALPDPALGALICEGVEVELYDYLPRAALDWLVFTPSCAESVARIALLPDARGAEHGMVVALVSTDFPAARPVVSVDAEWLAWRQANGSYWAHLAVLTDSPAAV
ncbi:MAG: hypothetical protein RR197_04525 [Oscillospiraceae bacterium]